MATCMTFDVLLQADVTSPPNHPLIQCVDYGHDQLLIMQTGTILRVLSASMAASSLFEQAPWRFERVWPGSCNVSSEWVCTELLQDDEHKTEGKKHRRKHISMNGVFVASSSHDRDHNSEGGRRVGRRTSHDRRSGCVMPLPFIAVTFQGNSMLTVLGPEKSEPDRAWGVWARVDVSALIQGEEKDKKDNLHGADSSNMRHWPCLVQMRSHQGSARVRLCTMAGILVAFTLSRDKDDSCKVSDVSVFSASETQAPVVWMDGCMLAHDNGKLEWLSGKDRVKDAYGSLGLKFVGGVRSCDLRLPTTVSIMAGDGDGTSLGSFLGHDETKEVGSTTTLPQAVIAQVSNVQCMSFVSGGTDPVLAVLQHNEEDGSVLSAVFPCGRSACGLSPIVDLRFCNATNYRSALTCSCTTRRVGCRLRYAVDLWGVLVSDSGHAHLKKVCLPVTFEILHWCGVCAQSAQNVASCRLVESIPDRWPMVGDWSCVSRIVGVHGFALMNTSSSTSPAVMFQLTPVLQPETNRSQVLSVVTAWRLKARVFGSCQPRWISQAPPHKALMIDDIIRCVESIAGISGNSLYLPTPDHVEIRSTDTLLLRNNVKLTIAHENRKLWGLLTRRQKQSLQNVELWGVSKSPFMEFTECGPSTVESSTKAISESRLRWLLSCITIVSDVHQAAERFHKRRREKKNKTMERRKLVLPAGSRPEFFSWISVCKLVDTSLRWMDLVRTVCIKIMQSNDEIDRNRLKNLLLLYRYVPMIKAMGLFSIVVRCAKRHSSFSVCSKKGEESEETRSGGVQLFALGVVDKSWIIREDVNMHSWAAGLWRVLDQIHGWNRIIQAVLE